jgi:Co/Zn/Cd efflux system component
LPADGLLAPIESNLTHFFYPQCSAYTHVFADTLRSVAVIIAAALAEIFDDVTAEEADASAAMVVSLLILLSLVPLFQGLVHSITELLEIRAEERSEAMSEEIQEEKQLRLTASGSLA